MQCCTRTDNRSAAVFHRRCFPPSSVPLLVSPSIPPSVPFTLPLSPISNRGGRASRGPACSGRGPVGPGGTRAGQSGTSASCSSACLLAASLTKTALTQGLLAGRRTEGQHNELRDPEALCVQLPAACRGRRRCRRHRRRGLVGKGGGASAGTARCVWVRVKVTRQPKQAVAQWLYDLNLARQLSWSATIRVIVSHAQPTHDRGRSGGS